MTRCPRCVSGKLIPVYGGMSCINCGFDPPGSTAADRELLEAEVDSPRFGKLRRYTPVHNGVRL